MIQTTADGMTLSPIHPSPPDSRVSEAPGPDRRSTT
jgi:hypothetical protein